MEVKLLKIIVMVSGDITKDWLSKSKIEYCGIYS